MGVLACSRSGCENVMCDRYSHKYGYICDDCFEELIEWIRRERSFDIDQFMNTYKPTDPVISGRKVYDILDDIFPKDRE